MKKSSKKYISIPAFAKELDCTPEYIRRLIQTGKIPDTAWVENGKRKFINPEEARSELDKNLSHVNRRKKVSKKPKQNNQIKTKSKLTTQEKLEALKDAGMGGENLKTLSEAQRIDTNYKALLRKQEYEEKQGKLIPADQVEKEAFEAGRKIRDQLQSIPDRCATLVAAELDPFECKQILMKEINHILYDLHNAIRVSKHAI